MPKNAISGVSGTSLVRSVERSSTKPRAGSSNLSGRTRRSGNSESTDLSALTADEFVALGDAWRREAFSRLEQRAAFQAVDKKVARDVRLVAAGRMTAREARWRTKAYADALAKAAS